jgi:hypothetical protein
VAAEGSHLCREEKPRIMLFPRNAGCLYHPMKFTPRVLIVLSANDGCIHHPNKHQSLNEIQGSSSVLPK